MSMGPVRTLIAASIALTAAHGAWSAPLPPGAKYVALGSSFAAAPGVTTRAPGSPPLCSRSADNYPHLLAKTRGLNLTDVTCSGATTADILTAHQWGQPPQIEAVTPDTRLVTLTIGGNDIAFIGDLWADSCIQRPASTPDAWKPYICKATPADAVSVAFYALPGRLHAVIAAIRARAPAARIVVVDYVTVLPATGDCPDRAPLSPGEWTLARLQAAQLKATTARIAAADHVALVKASDLTAGHDVCAADPWVFPDGMPPTLTDYGPFAYHPTAKAMAVIAQALDEGL